MTTAPLPERALDGLGALLNAPLGMPLRRFSAETIRVLEDRGLARRHGDMVMATGEAIHAYVRAVCGITETKRDPSRQ